MHQIQNKEDLIKINEYQKFLVNQVLDFQFEDHGKVLNPNKPNARLMQQKVNQIKDVNKKKKKHVKKIKLL